MSPLTLSLALATEKQATKKLAQTDLRNSLTFRASFIFTVLKH